MKYPIIKDYIPVLNTYPGRRPGKFISNVVFGVAHDTGNPGSTARNNVDYYKRTAGQDYASAHIFVDDKQIIECVPFFTARPEKAYHVVYNTPIDNRMYGVDANDCALGIELCYGRGINFAEAYKRYVWLWAFFSKKYGFDPAVKITSHKVLDPANRSDPFTAFNQNGITWNGFIADIKKEMRNIDKNGNALGSPMPEEKPVATAKGQIGLATIIQKEPLNVRSKPDAKSTLVKTLPVNSTWRVYEKKDGFYNVGGDQWISANTSRVKYVAVEPLKEINASGTNVIGIIEIINPAGYLNLRNAPSLNSTVIRRLPKGSRWKAYKEKDGFYNVGGDQWVSSHPNDVRFV